MKIYNTYTSQLEEFKPVHEGRISMYVCGPTVYNYIHIGNARPVIFFDVVRRYFESLGYDVTYVSNFTDVDDKIIQKALDSGKSEKEVANFYIDAFLKDVSSLGSKTDYIKPRVTETMEEIISYIDELVKKGYAYVKDGDVYFRVTSIKEYGHLSNRNIDDLISGSRVEVNENKENPLDFTLWKQTNEGISWDSPFSKGRPGWHTECCTMIDHIFHEEIDIHGGGTDLIFPHHENEIAQSMAMHQHPLAHYWMHNGRLNMEGEKMSKSIGNIIWVKDLPGNPKAFRLFMLQTHYRSPINFSLEHLETADKEYSKLQGTLLNLRRTLDLENEYKYTDLVSEDVLLMKNQFKEAMESDFNTANAITELQAWVKLVNTSLRQKKEVSYLQELLTIGNEMLDILGLNEPYLELSVEDKELFNHWNQARKDKNFDLADTYREKLSSKGLL